MGGQVEQLAEAVITNEVETAERLKKTDWPRGSRRFRQLGNRERANAAARATAQAEQRDLKWKSAAREAAELARKLKWRQAVQAAVQETQDAMIAKAWCSELKS